MDHGFTKEDWGQYAECYDALNELRPYVEMLEDICELLKGAEYPLLDAGCGTGNLIARLTRRAEMVTGIDSCAVMLERAKKKCPGAEFLFADLHAALPFGDSAFGTALCINVLYALADPAQALREFARVLRSGGLLLVVVPELGYQNGLILKSHCGSRKPDSYWLDAHASAEREEFLVHKAIKDSALAECFLRIARFNGTITRQQSFRFFREDELAHLAQENGFVEARITQTYAGQNLLLIAKCA